MRLSIIALAALAFGCQRHAPTCESAVSGAMDRLVADAKSKMPAPAAANIARVLPKLKAVITSACTQDKWSAAAISCIDHARTKQELDSCDAQLTPEQRAAERRPLDDILRAAVQPLGGAPADPNAPKAPPADPHAGMNLGSAQ